MDESLKKCVFLFYSLNGYGTLGMFKDLTDDDINNIEIYARTELFGLLQTKATTSNQPLDESLLAAFYLIYAVSPQTFQFVPGDRKFIQKLRKRVINKISSDGEKYFQPQHLPKNKRKLGLKGTSESLFGLIYGDFTRSQNLDVNLDLGARFSQGDLHNRLFGAARKMFGDYEDEIAMRGSQSLSTDMVEVNVVENGIKGTVTCALCRKQKTKVFCKTALGSNAFCWVLANLKKHILNCLQSENVLDIDEIECNKNNNIDLVESHNNNDNDINNLMDDNKNESMVQLDVTPVDQIDDETLQTDYEDLLATQIMVQVLKMVNTVYQCKDKEEKVYCDFGTRLRKLPIKICDVSANGDCLFSAISHQLSHVRINSREHQIHTQNLRNEVAEHLEANLPNYLFDLKNRLLESGEVVNEQTQEQQCINFIKNKLSHSGTFGGTESFMAVSAIKKVNIIVFNENGTCYFASKFDPTHQETIMVAFRDSNQGLENKYRNHFGSVTEIDQKLASKVSQYLIDKHMQYIRNKDRNSIIEI